LIHRASFKEASNLDRAAIVGKKMDQSRATDGRNSAAGSSGADCFGRISSCLSNTAAARRSDRLRSFGRASRSDVLTTGKLIGELAIRYCAGHEMESSASDLRDDRAIVMTLAADDVNSEERVHTHAREAYTRVLEKLPLA